jgi:hypothetical protein
MFFSGFPRLIGLHHFPCLHTLTVIGQSITVLTGLTSLTMLRELWVAECFIQVSRHPSISRDNGIARPGLGGEVKSLAALP